MKHPIKSIIFALLLFSLCSAQSGKSVSNVGTTSAPFLEIGVGSRAISMGGAFVATANDATAMYWNAAGLGLLTKVEAIFVHTDWLAGISYDYAGMVFPVMDNAAIGLNIISLATDDMKVRTVEYPEGTGELFDAASFSMGLSYGMMLTDRFAIGVNVKYISERIWKERATSFAIDLGTLYTTAIPGLRIGASLSNFGADMQMNGNDLLVYHDIDESHTGNNDRIFSELQTDSWPLPLLFQFGIAYDILNNSSQRITIETDALHPVNNKESMNAGIEYAFGENYFLRAGYRNLFLPDSEEGLTFGGGFQMQIGSQLNIFIDYAYADFGRLGKPQRFTLGLRF